MSDSMSGLAQRAAELRLAFDRGFAAPLRIKAAATQNLLAIRVSAEPYAIRLSEVTGLFVDRKFTRVPGGNPALLGIAGFRGALVPVYSLRALLGHSGTHVSRWLVIAAAAPVALAFDLFEGHLRAPADAILPRQSPEQMRGYAPEFIRTASVVRPILYLPSVIDALGPTEAPNTKPNQE
jgi:chemotaxis signal transduction protein